MAVIDRRRGVDRRKSPRYAVNIEIEWEDAKGRKQGIVSDISLEGCFVLCSGEVENGDKIRLFFPTENGMPIEFWCEVANYSFEIGFGARFIELSEAKRQLLEQFLKNLG